MMVSRRTYLLVSALAAVVPIGVAALASTAPCCHSCGALGAYLGVLSWLRPTGGYGCWPSRSPGGRG